MRHVKEAQAHPDGWEGRNRYGENKSLTDTDMRCAALT